MAATIDHDGLRFAHVSADTLRYARKRSGLSLTAAAKRAGISRSSLAAYERGTRTPSLERLFSTLEALSFAVRIELEPRIRERDGVARGDELVEVIRLAEQFPPRERPVILLRDILRDAAAKRGDRPAQAAETDRG